jgi:hypothetical protein
MENLTTSELIRSASRGYGYEEALADENLKKVVSVSDTLIASELQIPPYSQSILTIMQARGLVLLSNPAEIEIEPTARQVRGGALLSRSDVEQTYLIPKDALRMHVGSAAITARNVEHVREQVVRTTADPNNNVTIAFYENYRHIPKFDPLICALTGFMITASGSPHMDARTSVWTSGRSILAPEGSAPAKMYPKIAGQLLQHSETVTGADALEVIDNALDYLYDDNQNS